VSRRATASRQSPQFLSSLSVCRFVVAELDIDTAVVAARLRARHGQKVKLPDALVIATAIHVEAGVLVTTDRGWPPKSKLGFEGNLIKL